MSYMKENKRKEAERFSELEQKESNELKLIKENYPQCVGELSSEAEKDAEMEGEEIKEEKDEKNEVKWCDTADNIKEIAQFNLQIEWEDYAYFNVKMEAMNIKEQKTKEITIPE